MPPVKLTDIEAHRICIIKPSALGDVVQALPLLPVLRARFPKARISWVINRELAELLVGHPDLDELLPFDRRGPWGNWRQLYRDLKRRRFDIAFDLQGLFRTGLMTAATRAPIRIGLQTAREGSHLFCNAIISGTDRRVPAHKVYWRVAEELGLGDAPRRSLVALGSEEQAWARQRLDKLPRPLLGIHPGARWTTKRWPVENFAVVAGKAMRNQGLAAVLVGGPAEQPVAVQLEHLLHRFAPSNQVVNLTGQTSLKQLAAVLDQTDVLLTNDSGPMHLAAAMKTPVVGVFTCTNAVRSGPGGEEHELVSTQLSCGGSYKKRCPYRGAKHMACLEELSTSRVSAALERIIDQQDQYRRAA